MASTAELEAEILADLEENPDAYTAPVNDVITIDPETKTINLPSSEVLFGTEEEQGVERKYFKCPRIVGDNIDLFTHQIYISYMAVRDKNATFIPDSIPKSYWCDDVALDETGNYITFSWLLSGNVLASRGFVGFAVIAKSVEGDILKTRWKTAPAVGTVLMTLPDAGEGISELYPDIITQLLDRMDAVEEIATVEAMQGYVEKYLGEHPVQLDSTLTDPEKAAPANVVGELKGDLNEVALSTGSAFNFTPNYTEGHYVSADGKVYVSAGFAYSDAISVKRGDRVILNALGYQSNIAMIACNHIEGSAFYEPLVISRDGVNHYEYLIPIDMEIVVSFYIASFKGLSIISDTELNISESVNESVGALAELTTNVNYSNLTPIGTLYSNKNAQLTESLKKAILTDGSNSYKCLVIDNLTNVKFISAYCTIGSNARYECGIICTDENDFVIKAFNTESSLNVNKTIEFEVPNGTSKIYVNGIYITPTANSVERTLEFKGVSSEIVNGMLDYKTLTYVNGYYIETSGVKYSNVDFRYSESFYLKPCHLMIKARGYLTNVAILSKGKTSDSTVSPLIISTDSTAKVYSIDITEEGYYLICTSSDYDAEVIAMPLIYSTPSNSDNPYCDLSIFRKFGVVGDSYASGEVYYGNTYHDKYFNSWGQVLARKHGTTCTNYSSGGLTTRSWLTATKGLPLLLSSDAEDIYYLALGINDYYHEGQSYLGDITDITSHQSYEDYGDTFYGNYGRIIEQIQTHAPHAKIVMFTVANTSTVPQMFSDAIIEIAEHYNIPYIVQAEDPFFQSSVYTRMAGGHPTSIGYSGMAVAFERLLNKCIVDNLTYFFDLYMYD